MIAGCLALLVGLGVVIREFGATSPRGATAVTRGQRPTTTLLLVHHDPLRGNDLIVLFGRDGPGASVLLIPSATQLDVPALGVATLGAVPIDDRGARLANSVENVLGVGVSRTVVVDDAGLAAVLGPAAPIPVTLSGPVNLLAPSVKFNAGTQDLSAAQAAQLLSGPQSVNELDRLVTVSAVIEGWLTRLRNRPIDQRTLAVQGDLGPIVETATASGHRTDTLPVDSIAITGGDRFAVRESDLIAYVKRALPNARLGTGRGRPRVEVLNGTGSLGVAQAVAHKVVPAGGKITLTENFPGFGVPTTQIVYYKDEWRGAAQRLLAAMGCGSLRKAGKDVGVADVTILVGSDCPAYGAPPGGGN